MNEINLKEIIEYSKKIEQESYNFYKAAANIFQNIKTKEMAENLATDELKHYDNLDNLAEKFGLSTDDIQKKLITSDDFSKLTVETNQIDKSMSDREILNIALEREKKTETLYNTFLTFTNLNLDIIALFETLSNQENGHVTKVFNTINNLK